MFTLHAALLLPLVALPLPAPRVQNESGCPNQSASHVAGAEQDLAPWRMCFMQVHVLGVVISIGTGRCPTGHTSIAAHEECLGVYTEGRDCAEGGVLPIELELCRCVPHGGSTFSISTCDCHSVGALGFITTGQTIACH